METAITDLFKMKVDADPSEKVLISSQRESKSPPHVDTASLPQTGALHTAATADKEVRELILENNDDDEEEEK